MYLIYDKILQRHIGITEVETDVSLMSPDYELRDESPEWLADFDTYKLEQAVEDTTEIIEEMIEKNVEPSIIEEKTEELEAYKEEIAE